MKPKKTKSKTKAKGRPWSEERKKEARKQHERLINQTMMNLMGFSDGPKPQ